MLQGSIFDIQRFSIQDGPGIRTTVFLKGCPLACVWCHNPESRSGEPETMTLEHRCIRCGACLGRCPAQARVAAGTGRLEDTAETDMAERSDRLPLVPDATCTACGRCVDACPTGARLMVGRPYTVDELIRELSRDWIFHEESGGGVTFSGGEPLAQREFLVAALDAARTLGLHSAVDTSGLAPWGDLLAVAERTDLFLYDLKLVDDQQHFRYTGVSNALILSNLEALARAHGNLWVRIPVIPGINDDDEAAHDMAAFLARLPGIREIQLSPYHATGVPKFARLGLTYDLPAAEPPSPFRLGRIGEIYLAAGLATTITR